MGGIIPAHFCKLNVMKVKVIRDFICKNTGKQYRINDIVEFEVERAKELIERKRCVEDVVKVSIKGEDILTSYKKRKG